MEDVYVVEIATSGPQGYPMDRVVEISATRVLADGSDFDTVYDSFVFADPLDIGKDSLDYLDENYGIDPGTLYSAPDLGTVRREVLDKLKDKVCTSFNVGYTFGSYLCVEPWDFNGEMEFLPSIASRLPPEHSATLDDAYSYVSPGNPLGIQGKTSMDMCLMSTSIMMGLRRSGFFRSSVTKGYVESDERIQH